jgi:hypothetical protein
MGLRKHCAVASRHVDNKARRILGGDLSLFAAGASGRVSSRVVKGYEH